MEAEFERERELLNELAVLAIERERAVRSEGVGVIC